MAVLRDGSEGLSASSRQLAVTTDHAVRPSVTSAHLLAERLHDVRARLVARGDRGIGDFAALAALLMLTAMFGRPFSKLGIGSARLYVTEPVIAATVLLALWRVGVRGAVDRVRTCLPLVPLVLFWVAGAIALARGLHGYGLGLVTHDVGLVEYSIFVPLVAVAVDTEEKARAFLRVLLAAGCGAAAVFAVVYFFAPHSAIGIDANPPPAIGFFIGIFVILLAARLFHLPAGRRDVGPALAAGCGAILMSLLVVRSVTLGLVLAGMTLVALTPPGKRRRAAIVTVAGLAASIGGALVVEVAGIGPFATIAPTVSPFSYAVAAPNYVADDSLTPFTGGATVTGDAAVGTKSREVRTRAAKPQLNLATLTGLRPHHEYTIAFWVRPVGAGWAYGRVGDTSGGGWGQVRWIARPTDRWQHVSGRLVATAAAHRLVLYVDGGPNRVRFDGVTVRVGKRTARRTPPLPPLDPKLTSALPRTGGTKGKAPAHANEDRRPGAVVALTDTFGGESGTGFHTNQRWRLSFWKYMLARVEHRPLLGFGFGMPSAFKWRGLLYDGRRGDPADPNDVTGPHNSFVDVLFRMGLLGFVPLVALVALAILRTAARLREGPSPEERAALAGIAAAFVFAAVIASFNVALEGPYISMFFWSILALLFVLPRGGRRARARSLR